MASDSTNTLELDSLSLSIGGKPVCQQLSMTFKPGEFWGVMGINGVGKSTLLQCLIGLRQADQGQVILNNQPLSSYKPVERARKMGLMLQEYEYNFPCTVMEAALIGRHPFVDPLQWENNQDRELAHQALKQLDLEHLSERFISTLSGGEKRRLNLATLMTQNPDYYLLDEPVNHLDIKAQLDILSLLQSRFTAAEQKTHCGIMVIHDPNLAWRYCDHLLLLDNGQCTFGKTHEVLTTENLSRLYHCKIEKITDQQHTIFIATP